MPLLQEDDRGPFDGDDCPPWCEGKHDGGLGGRLSGDEPFHTLSAGLQPVIAGAPTSGHPMEAYPSEFDVVRYQGTCDQEEWVFVGDDDIGWCLTIESASRIYRALGEVLVGSGPY